MEKAVADKVKVAFWSVVSRSGGEDWFRKTMPEWCDAVDALPDTEKLEMLNVMEREIMSDVIESCGG